jgi:tellurite resistance protein
MILGLSGTVIAYQKMEGVLGVSFNLSFYLLLFTFILFIILSVVYLTKIFKFKQEVNEEFSHPVKLSFFPTYSISLLLLSIAFLEVDCLFSFNLWFLGAVLHFFFTIKIISIWIQHTKFEINHMNPAWFIPAVGNILVPIAGVVHFPEELSWFFFSVGLIFWLILLIIFFNRIIFHSPLPSKLLPTLFILIAPPAIGFISLFKLQGEVTDFGRILYFVGLFLVILLFSQVGMFGKIKFYFSWWAYSFPMAAITIASVLMFHETGLAGYKYISFLCFFILNLIVATLIFKTVKAVYEGRICVKED